MQQTKSHHSKILLTILALTVYWAFSIWLKNNDEFSPAHSWFFLGHVILVLAIEFSIYFGLNLMAKRVKFLAFLPMFFGALFLTTHAYTLELFLYPEVNNLDVGGKFLLYVGLTFIFFALLHFIVNSKSKLMIIGVVFILIAYQLNNLYSEQQTTAPGNLPANFTTQTFKTKPNVYFLSFDAMIPESMANKFMGIPKLGYIATLKSEGLNVLKNSFSPHSATKPTLSAILAMDEKYAEKYPHVLITRAIESPLYHTFAENGYKMQFAYATSYFGYKENTKLDFYSYPLSETVCEHMSHKSALLGFCEKALVKFRASFAEKTDDKYSEKYPKFLFDRIKDTASQEQPWFTYAYILLPGHTQYRVFKDELVDGYTNSFPPRVEATSKAMKQFMAIIKKHDPTAVVIMFGDHGALITRPLEVGNIPEDLPYNDRDLYLDGHAVVTAVYPHNFCLEEFKTPYSLMRIGRSVIKCLSGQDPFPAEYQKNDDHLLPYVYE